MKSENVLILYDSDEEYAQLMGEYLMGCKGLPWKIAVCTSEKDLPKICKGRVSTLVVSSSVYNASIQGMGAGKIIVLDEPTSNLDPIGTESVFMIIDELNKKEGMTIILVEHEIELMAQFVDRFIVLDEGQVILDGTPEEVFSHRDVFEKIGIFVPTVTEIASIADKKYGSWDGSKYPITLDEMLDKIDERL